MLRILSFLFPLWILLPKAKALGSVTFSTIPDGWHCVIRPSTYGPKPRGLNSWSAMAKTMGAALRQAMRLASENPEYRPEVQTYAPKLGGREFDPDTN